MLVFYRPDSEHARQTEVFLRDLGRQSGINAKDIKPTSIDTREGSSAASLYDIWDFPGVVVTEDNGSYIKHWSGDLPLLSEVAGYAYSR